MANPLPEENKLYEQIRTERITINPEIWDLLYHRIGDDLSAINLLCQYYLKENQPIPFTEAGKILKYTRHIKDIINKITSTAKVGNQPFPEIEETPLHPILREMFTHYIGNDVYCINLIVEYSINHLAPENLSLENTKKILRHTRSIREFMDKLRESTSKQEITAVTEGQETEEARNKNLSQEEIFLKIRKLFSREFNTLSEDKITPKTRFTEDMQLDSIDAIQVIMILEEAFGLEIPDDDAEGVLTVGQAASYIYKRLEKKHK